MLIGLTLCTRPLPYSFPPPPTLRIVELGNIWRRFLGALISPRAADFYDPTEVYPYLQYPPRSAAHCQLLWLAAVRFVIDGLDTAKDYANPNDLCPTASVQNCEIMENWQHWTQWDKRRHLSSSSCLMKTCVGHKTIIMIYIPASSSIWLQIERDQFALSTRVCLCVCVPSILITTLMTTLAYLRAGEDRQSWHATGGN